MAVPDALNSFLDRFRGSFTSTLRWHQLDELWQRLGSDADAGWYLYDLDAPAPPQAPADAAAVKTFITNLDHLLRREHREDYCGIVYADDLQAPTFVKIYHPKRLGVACGFSDQPPLPGWIMSLTAPMDLHTALAPAPNPRWWGRLLRTGSEG
ncbi:MAG: hypothetical protein GVY09_04905 [Gammaproteobacteria bacterium]|nr:hypothetical protein [Gammaproteobacteria bacterium]